MNQLQARTLREARDAYVQRISRSTKAALATMYRDDLAERNRSVLFGGPANKQELISALVELHYPLAQMNESIHVLYHGEFANDACEHCNPLPACGVCGSTGTCHYERGDNSPVVNGRHADA